MNAGTSAPAWETRFRTPHLLTVRPAAGDPSTALVVTNDPGGATARILDGASGTLSPPLPLAAGHDSLLTADRRWVVQLDDDGGSEVGHLTAYATDGGARVDLTPERAPYVLRGIDLSVDGRTIVVSAVDEDGHHLLAIPAAPWGEARTLASTPNESWYARVSADGTLASADTTDHNPGVRRAGVTVYDVASGAVVAFCDDLPAGPVRAVRFSPVPGDGRLLLSTERSGWARPAIWDPRAGTRADFDLPGLRGEAIPLDWDARNGRVLVLHVEDGIQRLLLLDAGSGELTVVRAGTGSYADPDVAAPLSWYSNSYLAADGSVRVFEQDWATPPRLLAIDVGTGAGADAAPRELAASAPVPAGRRLDSALVTSADGTPVQLWWALPEGPVRGTVLEVHGGPNLVTTDHYSPQAQAWLEEGFAFASLNYRGSVTFGRDHREGFWGRAGDPEIEDVAAALDWLGGRGLARPESTFVTGPSYGGHLTLLSLGRLPHAFAGGFAHVAMADWSAALADMNPAVRVSWINFLTSPSGVDGERLTLEQSIARFSPISYVDAVAASVWLSQGTRDTRTPPAQAQGYVDALRSRGADALVEWYDAGHEPVGLDGPLHAQRRMLTLARAAIDGRRWVDAGSTR